MLQLTKNFSLSELTKSGTALRLNIDNTPSPEVIERLEMLCIKIAQPVREYVRKAVTVNSGYRCPLLNAAIGSSWKSQHVMGQALDIEVWGLDNYVLACWIRDNLEFDQLILEFYTGEPQSGWVHISYVSIAENRNECLTINKGNIKRGLVG